MRTVRVGAVAMLGLRTTRAAVGGAATVGGITAGKSERGGTLVGGPLLHGFLSQDDPREDGVEWQRGRLVTEDDTNRVHTFVKPMEELGGDIHLGDGVVDVGKAVGEELNAVSILHDGEIALFKVVVLAIEEHEAGGLVGKKEIGDILPEGVGGGGTDNVIGEGIGKGGINPESHMGVELKEVRVGVGWEGLRKEEGDPVSEKHHEKEGFPFVVVVGGGIKKKLDVVCDVITENGVARGVRRRGGWCRRSS
ncbi:hypothetical protein D1007_59229 [Hordeum vulgare]|nr:hypothetical protein D1007_59229 [Hordeum vulgare]